MPNLSNYDSKSKFPRGAAVGFITILLVCLLSCSRKAPPVNHRHTELVVFAASSLRDAFTEIGEEFERAHPHVEVILNFAGTQELLLQINHGATVDVFASADMRHVDELVRTRQAESHAIFAYNEPVLIVSKEAYATIRNFAELANASRIVIGAPEVPIGRYTLQILERASTSLRADFRARVEAGIVSRELNVRQVLSKVRMGEAQAGIVYRSDALSAHAEIETLPIPGNINAIAEYPIAILTRAPHRELANAWVRVVLSDAGRRALRKAGFESPSGEAVSYATAP